MTEKSPSHGQPASALAVFMDAIDAALPQTQCTRCGYPDCRRYAEAIARGEAPINQCPPGGQAGVERLAALTGQPVVALNPDNGIEGVRVLARIDENWCIGCTLCIKVCPTDAILGANKRMHTIIAEACTGCELCLPVCPVDCIELDNASGDATGWAAWSQAQADQALERYNIHSYRMAPIGGKQAKRPESTPPEPLPSPAGSGLSPAPNANKVSATPSSSAVQPSQPAANADKKATIAAILAKARQQRDR